MITSGKSLLMMLLYISCSICATAQTDYYYYQGKQIPLTLNENKVCVSIPKECNTTSERIRANVQVLVTISDKAFDIFVITRSDYEKLNSMDFWEEEEKNVVLTSCYFTEKNEEVFATPYLYVRLKKEQDIDLLDSCVKEYNLKIVEGSSPLMPLWFVLSLTLETNKSSLQCANALWETGYFASSEPDFAASDILDEPTPIRSIFIAKPNASSEIFDLSGRRLPDKPRQGIYIEEGKKKLKAQ